MEVFTRYLGENESQYFTKNKLTYQKTEFLHEKVISSGELLRDCFEIKLLNRLFLIVPEHKTLYEVFKEKSEETHTLLTTSYIDTKPLTIIGNFSVKIMTLWLHYEYAPLAEFLEEFEIHW